MIVESACHWVIARLPLGVSGAGEPVDLSANGGDLALEDLRAVRRHLVACAACRQHESSMRQAAEALAVAAVCPPLQTDPSSLWPEMQRRIAAQGTSKPAVGKTASIWPVQAWGRIERMVQNWFSPDGSDLLRGAWLRDELRETLDAAIATTHLGPRLRLSLIAGSGLAAILLTLWIVVPAAQQQELAARAMIASNETAPAQLAGPPEPSVARTVDHSQPTINNRSTDNNEASAEGSLAQAEPVRVVEASPPPAPEPAPVAKPPSPPTRFNYDLEHGTPMPPDSRDPKPVY